jgi:DNA polymerase-3 subunit gamma/tau
MQYAPHPRLVLEMTFARIVQTVQVVPIATLIAKIDELLAADNGKQPSVRPPVSPVVPEKKNPESAEVVPAVPARLSEPSAPFAVQGPPRVSVISAAPVDVQGSPVAPVAWVPDTPAAIGPAKDVRKDWDDFVAYVKDRKDWMAQIIKMCDSVQIQDGLLKLKYNDSSQCPILNQTDNLKALTEFAQDFFQRELRVKVLANGGICGKDGDEGAAGLQEERVALRRDPLALLVAEVFNGHVGDVRTGPRSRVVVDDDKAELSRSSARTNLIPEGCEKEDN